MEPTFSFGDWLHQRRRTLHLTQEVLGQCVGCASETIRKIEADARRPSREIAERLAECLAIAPEERAAFLRFARGESSNYIPGTFPARTATPPGHQAVMSVTNVPIPPTPVIGRTREVATIGTLLRRPTVRLLTLSGPGGVGKTRLAIETARALQQAFTDGVWFVPLAPLRDAALVLPTIGRTLGIPERPDQSPVAHLGVALHNKQMLLVVDNVEQVLAAASDLAALLAATRHLKLLLTSRVVLRLAGEHEFPVPPLVLPQRQPPPSVAALSQYDAVALFIQRAQTINPTFQVTNATAPAIAEICHRLDGLPLAIELAAARSKLLAPQALLARLASRLTLLTSGARDLPVRQQTLRRTIDWSYDLLAPGEQALFARLAVFAGGCSVEAAEAVCAVDGTRSSDILDGLQVLLDHSLLTQIHAPDGAVRLTMLETIHEYAWERLEVRGEANILQARQAAYYLALAEQAEPHLQGADQHGWLARLAQDQDNLRQVLRWVRDTGQTDMLLRLCAAVWYFWFIRGAFSEGRQWLAVALARSDSMDTVVRAKVLAGAGFLHFMHADALGFFQESLAIGRAVGDPFTIAFALLGLGSAEFNQEQYGDAVTHLEESQTLFQALGDTRGTASSHFALGRALFLAGNYARAATHLEASVPLFEEVGEHFLRAWAHNVLGYVRYQQGTYAAAAAQFQDGLALAVDLGAQQVMAECLEGLASVAGGLGNRARAARLFGAAEALREALGTPLAPADRANYTRSVARAQTSVDAASFAAAWAEGRAMPVAQAIAEALADDADQQAVGMR